MTPRILWLTKGLGRGGAEQLLCTLAAHMDPADFTIDVAYLLPWKDALADELRSGGHDVVCLHQRSNYDLRWTRRLRRLVQERDYAVVHAHMPIAAVGARTCLAQPRPAVVYTEHNIWQRYSRPTYWANAATYARNDKVIAVSHAVAQSIRPEHVPGHALPDIEVIHHGIPLEHVPRGRWARARSRRRLGLSDDAFVIGTVGNLTPKKGQRVLIAAFARLHQSVPHARLVLIGGGPLSLELRRQVEELGIAGATLFTGVRDDVKELLPAFDIFALTSVFEGLSIALVEACAAGVAVVATAVGGVPEVVRHESEGLLVPPQDVAAVTTALQRLLDDPEERQLMAKRGVQRAESFDIRDAAQRTGEIYDELVRVR